MILRQVQQTHEMGVNAAQRQETSFEIRRKLKTSLILETMLGHGDPLRDLLAWLEEFADDLVEEEAFVRSGTSGKQLGVRKAQHFYTHPGRPKLRSVQKGPTFTRAPFRKRTGNQVRRAVTYGGLITAAHEVLNEEGGAITGMPLWYKSWLLSGCNRIRAKPNLLRKRNRVNDSVSSRQPGQKSFTETVHQNLAKPAKICPGIIVHQRLTVPKQMVLQVGQYAE